ncbi:MAG: hypothetical protein GXW89_09500 [Phycisphaerae bacterium]|jgi:hypothetical protein|nr:hypothetical protein [Phycisphaerae bacterium]
MMTQQTQTALPAVVCRPDDAHKAALESHLAQRGIETAKWFTPGALHDLDRAVRQGRIRHVIFAGLPDLLQAIWEEEIVFEEWPADTHIEFLDPPGGDTVRTIAASWATWRQQHRRSQAWSGLLLSVLVLILSFALCVYLAR